MAFKEISSLEAETTISLGGTNRKTGKTNPTSIEGYYLGSKQVADKKKQSGVSHIYYFQTPKGNVGVWGKTDMDRKMASCHLGYATRVAFDKMRPTPNGEMYVYKVAQDDTNTIEVTAPPPSSVSTQDFNSDSDDFVGSFSDVENATVVEDEEEDMDQVAYSRPVPPKNPLTAPSATTQNTVRSRLLSRKSG